MTGTIAEGIVTKVWPYGTKVVDDTADRKATLTAAMKPSPTGRIRLTLPLLGAAAFLLFVSVASSWENARNADRRAALLADLHAGSLSTAAAFQARCGQASAQRATKDRTVLEYSAAQLLVTLPAQGTPHFQMLNVFREGGKYKNVAINVDEDFAIGRLHCEAK